MVQEDVLHFDQGLELALGAPPGPQGTPAGTGLDDIGVDAAHAAGTPVEGTVGDSVAMILCHRYSPLVFRG